MLKNNKAFTLVELVIVIIIVAILSIVGVSVYRGYVARAIMSEAKALMGAVERGEMILYSSQGQYHAVPEGTSYDEDMDIDIRGNKYFTSFKVTVNSSEDGGTATAITEGSGEAEGLSITLNFSEPGERAVWIEDMDK